MIDEDRHNSNTPFITIDRIHSVLERLKLELYYVRLGDLVLADVNGPKLPGARKSTQQLARLHRTLPQELKIAHSSGWFVNRDHFDSVFT